MEKIPINGNVKVSILIMDQNLNFPLKNLYYFCLAGIKSIKSTPYVRNSTCRIRDNQKGLCQKVPPVKIGEMPPHFDLFETSCDMF